MTKTSDPTQYCRIQCDYCLKWYSDYLKKCSHCQAANLDWLDKKAIYAQGLSPNVPGWRGKKDTLEDVLKERMKE